MHTGSTSVGQGARICLTANTCWYLYNFRRRLGVFLRSKGWETVMVCPPGPYVEKLQAAGFRWVPWDVGRQTLNPFAEIASLMRLTRIYRAEQPVLVHHSTIKPILYGTLAARRTGVPAIVNSVTGRGYVFLGGDTKVRGLRLLAKSMYRFALATERTRAIFENPTDCQYFIENGLIASAAAHTIQSSGVDAAHFHPQPEPTGAPVILMAARMLWDKGVGVLVDAARILSKRTKVRIALAGAPDPGNPASIPAEKLEEWHREGVVEWWGFQNDMNEAYGKCHIVALPTHYAEGLPISLTEAAACGRPIVATRVPGCVDFVADGHNGLLVPPNDPVALAEALEKLATDAELRQRMGQAGRQLVLEKYTDEYVNSATYAVYRELVAL